MIPIEDNIPTRRFPVVTVSLIVINVAVFIYELTLPKPLLEAFFKTYGLLPVDILHGQFQYIFTSMFIHGGWEHIIGNMLFLWIFGNNVEDALGRIKFLFFYLMCGIAAALLQSTVSIMFGNLYTPMVGASGAISGVLGAYIKLYPHAKVLTFIPPFPILFVLPAWFFIGYWFFLQVLFAMIVPPTIGGVAWYAHIGGFIAGWYLIDMLYSPKKAKVVHYSLVRY